MSMIASGQRRRASDVLLVMMMIRSCGSVRPLRHTVWECVRAPIIIDESVAHFMFECRGTESS
jgi:hypothetical protein